MTDKTTIARPYARAAFAAAQAHGGLPAWSDALHTAAAVVHDPRVASLLGNPHVTAKQMAEFVVGIGEGKLGNDWHELVNEQEGVADVTVTAATALDAKQQETLSAALTRRLQRKVRLHTEVDATLIGGAVIRSGDLVIDGSLRTRLERLAFELSA